MATTDELRERIERACQAAIARGLKIEPGGWGVEYPQEGGSPNLEGNCVCPLGALAWNEDLTFDNDECRIEDPDVVIAPQIDKSVQWIMAFTQEFDATGGAGSALSEAYPDAVALGREFRAKYVKAP